MSGFAIDAMLNGVRTGLGEGVAGTGVGVGVLGAVVATACVAAAVAAPPPVAGAHAAIAADAAPKPMSRSACRRVSGPVGFVSRSFIVASRSRF
jgi:hypothetical protein